MTDERTRATEHRQADEYEQTEERRVRAGTLVSDAARRIRSSPTLVVPFFVAGLLLAGVDWLRVGDAVPVQVTSYSLSSGFDVTGALYPLGVTRTSTAFDALVGLKLQYLAWVVGLELLSLVVVVGAGSVVVARVLDTSLSLAGVLRYAVFVGIFWSLPSADFGGPTVVAIALLVIAFALTVRLFALPALLVQGDGFGQALSRSWSLAAGNGWAVFGLVLGLGLVYSLVSLVPVVGPVLSTGLVGTLHAVALGLYVERAGRGVATRPQTTAPARSPVNS